MECQPKDDLIRELYARFGLAYFQSECLHKGLCSAFAKNRLPPRDLITRPRVEELLAQAFSMTLGDVVAKLEGILPPKLNGELQKALDIRNFLAHYFWFERVHLMTSEKNIHKLIAELNGYTKLFEYLDTQVSKWAEPKLRELGITDEVLQDSLSRILAGEPIDPLPNRQTVKDLEKKLSKQQTLIRVWEFPLADGRKPLIFELADGSLYQLSDIGLGWTLFHEIGPGWVEHPTIKPYLPADISPRPKPFALWDYEFTLTNGAVLWVKPGSKKQTFKWGVRKPKATWLKRSH
jgi:hypothetical protein